MSDLIMMDKLFELDFGKVFIIEAYLVPSYDTNAWQLNNF